MTAPQQDRPGMPPDQHAEADEIQDLEAPADTQEKITGGEDPDLTTDCK